MEDRNITVEGMRELRTGILDLLVKYRLNVPKNISENIHNSAFDLDYVANKLEEKLKEDK